MTYIVSTAFNSLAIDLDSLTVLSNSTTDFSISAGTVMQLGEEDQLCGSATYSVSSGVITLPSGYYYLVKGVFSATAPSDYATAFISYQFYDTGVSSYLGRRGWLIWQEYPKLNGGDEYAIALIDATSSSQTIDLRVVTKNGTISGDPTGSQSEYVGLSRVEVYKWS